MSIIRLVVLTIVINFTTCELAATSLNGNFNLQQYLGIWYKMALLLPGKRQNSILCDWFNVKPEYNCPGCFKEKYGKLSTDKVQPRVTGIGLFDGTSFTVRYPTLFNEELTFFATSYNNGNELIFSTPNGMRYSRLLSRNTTVSPETREAFESMAESAGIHAVFANPAKCVI